MSAFLFFVSASSLQAQTPLDSSFISECARLDLLKIQGDRIRSYVDKLASDSMEGRATGSAGYNRAANFISKFFQEIGVIPIGKDYFQNYQVAVTDLRPRIFIETDADSVDAKNVIGIIPGEIDSTIVLTAHLDHLGRDGKIIYHGANDNAGGCAVLMDLARMGMSYEKPRFTIVFVFFSGEEAGLLGSKYFSENSPIDLKKISLLINLDLVASGRDGLMLQAGTPYEVERVRALNKNCFRFELSTRPNSPNSDHYYFSKMGIPSFFIYAYKGTSPYHDPADTAEKTNPQILENVARFVWMMMRDKNKN